MDRVGVMVVRLRVSVAFPPQLEIVANDVDRLVFRLPRAPDPRWSRRASILGWVMGVVSVGVCAVQTMELGYSPWWVLLPSTIALPLVMKKLPWDLLQVLSRASTAITVDRQGLRIGNVRIPWSEIVVLRWIDGAKIDGDNNHTYLLIETRSGEILAFAFIRRVWGNRIGVTQRQRAWFIALAQRHLDRVGNASAVPAALEQLRR